MIFYYFKSNRGKDEQVKAFTVRFKREALAVLDCSHSLGHINVHGDRNSGKIQMFEIICVYNKIIFHNYIHEHCKQFYPFQVLILFILFDNEAFVSETNFGPTVLLLFLYG